MKLDKLFENEVVDIAAYERSREALDLLADAALEDPLSPEDEAIVVAHAVSILRRRAAVQSA